MVENAQELLEHELKDIYDAEHKLVKALTKMAKDAADEKLSKGFLEHRQVTEGQIERLDGVFEILGKKPRRQPCPGIDGLIKEYSKFVREEAPDGPVLNAFATGAALKVEHYEIVAYKTLIGLAEQLNLPEAVSLLEQNLGEEEETAQKLERLSKKFGSALATASSVIE
jgi:ferritin-like metal-binding protein YciE